MPAQHHLAPQLFHQPPQLVTAAHLLAASCLALGRLAACLLLLLGGPRQGEAASQGLRSSEGVASSCQVLGRPRHAPGLPNPAASKSRHTCA
jgi:hypothetical protein